MANESVRPRVDDALVPGHADVDGEVTPEIEDGIPAQRCTGNESRDARRPRERGIVERALREGMRDVERRPHADYDHRPDESQRSRICGGIALAAAFGDGEQYFGHAEDQSNH